ncbi:MAG TPA: cytochrome c oxidase subunit II [Longimicrobium sp.]
MRSAVRRVLPLLRPAPAAAAAVLLAACGGRQNVLNPAGIQAERIENLFWPMLVVASAVWLIVMAALLYAVFHRRRDEIQPEEKERRMRRGVTTAVGATVAILVVFLLLDFFTGRAVATPQNRNILTITVTGHQWWWEATYVDPDESRHLTIANEIHIPVGRPVRLMLQSDDVIHSFWVPNLHGKKDLIPGYTTLTWLRADRPGVYRGQCAEFCGHQHAKMGLEVVAEPEAEFARWFEHQLTNARPPADSVTRRGLEVFLGNACVMCHTIRGTPAGGSVAPDLTHLASRRTIAAAVLPNNRGHLGGWITDPQRIKPGTRMPANPIDPKDLHALLSYLETLR